MTEYITKDQAIHAMEQVTQPECFIEDTRKNFARIIEELPAADVVEVVRCKDCADFRPWGGQSKLGDCMVYVCDGENPFTMEETDFCSDGDRMDGED